jgi:hypothetical protein
MAAFYRPTASDKAKQSKGKVVAKTSSEPLAATNRGRIGLYVTNTGANNVYLALGDTAAADEGILLSREGGGATIDDYTGPVSVVTKTGESLVTFAEV